MWLNFCSTQWTKVCAVCLATHLESHLAAHLAQMCHGKLQLPHRASLQDVLKDSSPSVQRLERESSSQVHQDWLTPKTCSPEAWQNVSSTPPLHAHCRSDDRARASRTGKPVWGLLPTCLEFCILLALRVNQSKLAAQCDSKLRPTD